MPLIMFCVTLLVIVIDIFSLELHIENWCFETWFGQDVIRVINFLSIFVDSCEIA